MESKKTYIEPLLNKAEEFSKAVFDILKLKALDKLASVTSTIISRFLLYIIFLFFILSLNTALVLWLGKLLGKTYYGFLIVGGFYGIVSIIIFSVHPRIKNKLSNFIISQMLN